MSVLPKLTPEANRVHIIRSIENNDGDFDAMSMCKGSLKIIDYLMRREPVYGLVFLLDLKHCQLSYLLSFTPTLTKNLMRCIDVSINIIIHPLVRKLYKMYIIYSCILTYLCKKQTFRF